jgi:cellulose synthase/poly-beta-1,6-N-acetylglucosamine synthase-like glycosyltransferase
MAKRTPKMSSSRSRAKTSRQKRGTRAGRATRPRRARKRKKSRSESKKRAFNLRSKKSQTPIHFPSQQTKALIITSFKEKGLTAAIQAALHQTTSSFNIIVVSPDPDAKEMIKKVRNKNIKLIRDQGQGKVAALNQIFPLLKEDILIFTDGDVMLHSHAVEEIIKPFEDPTIGCVSGRVISTNTKHTMLGYWSHLLADVGAHKIRIEGAKERFLECTGYLFAFRNHIIKKLPTDVAEDTIVPYLLRKKGYGITYAPQAKVLVKNPTTIVDWIKQRKRTAKAHEKIKKYVNTKERPQVKSFSNEIKRGWLWALTYPQTIKEFYWTLGLFLTRLYMWGLVKYETIIEHKEYTDKWERIASTK